MQFYKPFIYNKYILLFKVFRLTSLAICLLFCLMLISCNNSLENSQKIPKRRVEIAENAINVNTATAEELQKLPRIGKVLAQRIIDYRNKYGDFRRTENLILVRGMSDKKFRELQNLVKVE